MSDLTITVTIPSAEIEALARTLVSKSFSSDSRFEMTPGRKIVETAVAHELAGTIDRIGPMVRACVDAKLQGIVEEVTCEALRKRVREVIKKEADRGDLLPLERTGG